MWWVAGALALAVLFQGSLFLGLFGEWAPGPPVVGEFLAPEVRVERLDGRASGTLREYLASRDSCSLLVVISTHCSYCARLRVGWRFQFHNWARQVGSPVRAIWLGTEGREALLDFYSGFDFTGIDLVRVTSSPAVAARELGLVGSPITYLVDRAGRLKVGVLGEGFPSAQEGRAVCE